MNEIKPITEKELNSDNAIQLYNHDYYKKNLEIYAALNESGYHLPEGNHLHWHFRRKKLVVDPEIKIWLEDKNYTVKIEICHEHVWRDTTREVKKIFYDYNLYLILDDAKDAFNFRMKFL